jgi:hypothetical protein
MPIAVICESCRFSTNAEDRLAGKRVRCPQCREPITVPEAVAQHRANGRSAPAAPKPLRPMPAAPTPVVAGEPIVVECTCGAKFRTKAEWAGRATKCPRCAKTLVIPMPAASEPEMFDPSALIEPEEATFEPETKPIKPTKPKKPAAEEAEDDEEWNDVSEAYSGNEQEAASEEADASEEDEEQPTKKAVVGSSGWGEEHLEEHELPDELHEKIQAELTRGERIEWCGRPDKDILIAQAAKMRIIGIVFIVLGLLLIGGGIAAMIPVWQARFILGPVLLLFAVFFIAGGVYAFLMPGRVKAGMEGRACFLITNRRLFIHGGIGNQVKMGFGSKRGIDGKARGKKSNSFLGHELTYMHRVEFAKMPGSGELHFSRTILDNPTGSHLWAVRDIEEVERKIRELLIHPVVDKMLTGEIRIKTTFGAREKSETDEELPVEGNMKDALAKQGAMPTDGNVKAAKAAAAKDLSKVDPDLRERVDAELTEGERVVWIGEPEEKTQGRGILGAVMGAEHRIEPDYELYAITNRRVMLFDKKGCVGGQSQTTNLSFGKQPKRGPVCYYPADLLEFGIEEDKRIPNGGGILFRKAKVVIIKKIRTSKQERGHHHGGGRRQTYGTTVTESTKKIVEMHHFGILRVANAKQVARLLYETLVRPCKR